MGIDASASALTDCSARSAASSASALAPSSDKFQPCVVVLIKSRKWSVEVVGESRSCKVRSCDFAMGYL